MLRRLVTLVVVLVIFAVRRRGRHLRALQHHPGPGDRPGRRHPRPGPRRAAHDRAPAPACGLVRARLLCPGRRQVPLGPGESVSFGRSAPRPTADLTVSDSPRVSRRAGTLDVTPFGVLLTNTGSNPLFVDEAVGPAHGPPGSGPPGHRRPGPGRLRRHRRRPRARGDRRGQAGRQSPAPTRRPRSGPARPGRCWRARPTSPASSRCASRPCGTRTARGSRPASRSPTGCYERGLLPERRTADWVDRRLDDVRAKLPVGERPWSAMRARNASTAEQQQAAGPGAVRRAAPRRPQGAAGRVRRLVRHRHAGDGAAAPRLTRAGTSASRTRTPAAPGPRSRRAPTTRCRRRSRRGRTPAPRPRRA